MSNQQPHNNPLPPGLAKLTAEQDSKMLEVLARHYGEGFVYHATQRLSTIRYFLVAFGALAVGYAQFYSKTEKVGAAILALLALVLCVLFRQLDCRNEQLVHLAEEPLKELQAHFRSMLGASEKWEPVRQSDNVGRYFRTFGTIVPCLYTVLLLVAAGGLYLAAVPPAYLRVDYVIVVLTTIFLTLALHSTVSK